MSNFTFIKADFPALYADAVEAERLTFDSPTATAVFCRSTLENAVNWLYDNDPKLERPYRSDLSTLMHEHGFSSMFNRTLFGELNLIRKTGNNAAHGTKVNEQAALGSVKNLFRFLRHLAIYYGKNTPDTQVFDEALIPNANKTKPAKNALSASELKKLLEKIQYKNEQARKAEEKIRKQALENNELKRQLEQQAQELAQRKQEREQAVDIEVAVPLLVSEAETRKRYIDCLLAEAGWTDLQDGYHLEYEVSGMPKSTNPSGIGYVDYVLWADDGLPLAIIEAKRTMADPRKGKHQAELYADCLEAEKKQRPIVFYSNGFETYLWDDQFSPEREIQGFYSKEELQLLIDRRDSRADLRDFKVNEDIAGRAYQLEAIQRVAENTMTINAQGELRGRSRRSLLVMATGSGKTRTSAALVDMFTKCNWAKRILFLADRNACLLYTSPSPRDRTRSRMPSSA